MVMIADDEIQADILCIKRLVKRAYTAIYRDDQFNAGCFKVVQRLVIKAIAFVEAMRNVASHVCIKGFQGLHKQCGSSNAIYIVITIDCNWLVLFKSELETFDGFIHSC